MPDEPASNRLSRSVEDYLKAIHELGGGTDRPIHTTALAGRLGVAPASVSGMVRRIAAAGLLAHVRYRGVRLTTGGRRAALRVIRRHRILECYLASRLGYDWDSIHDEAERLEHAASDELIERMALVLGDPTSDPHGAPIPTRNGVIQRLPVTPLADLPVGTVAQLRLVEDRDAERLRHLTSLGLEPGTRFRVLGRESGDGSVTVLVGQRPPVAVGLRLARALGCTPVANAPPSVPAS